MKSYTSLVRDGWHYSYIQIYVVSKFFSLTKTTHLGSNLPYMSPGQANEI